MYRTGSELSSKSEGYIRIARVRHAATIRSDTPEKTPSDNPSDRAVASFPISASNVSNPSGPGSDFNSASTCGRSSRSCNLPHTTDPSVPTTPSENATSNLERPDPTTRSTWPGVGGSTSSLRHLRRSASASRRRLVSVGHISSASHRAHRSSSSSVAGRVPNAP